MTYYAASVNDPETNRKFAESLGLDYPILSDPEKTTARVYGVLSPITRRAKRRTIYIDAGGTIVAIDRKVDPKTAGADVAARLEELGVPLR